MLSRRTHVALELAATRLQERIHSQVIIPGDPDYDEARQAWNRTVDQHPLMIVVAESAADIAEVVRFAEDHYLAVTIESSGQDTAPIADDGVLILSSQMTGA